MLARLLLLHRLFIRRPCCWAARPLLRRGRGVGAASVLLPVSVDSVAQVNNVQPILLVKNDPAGGDDDGRTRPVSVGAPDGLVEVAVRVAWEVVREDDLQGGGGGGGGEKKAGKREVIFP